MRYLQNILEAIGRTPLVRLNRVAADLDITLLAKVEALNPGGSVKDRIGLAMIEEAERQGLLRPGGTIIEATAGNTGVGLAQAAAIKGYRCIFVLPDKMSQDKINLLRAYGAEVIITPTSVPPDSPESYNGVAARLAREIPGAFRPNQFGNLANPSAHYRTTGAEIWADTGGKIDVFVAGIGTGGTISGVGRYLKEQNPKVKVVGADPAGSILSGDSPRLYKVEGIGEDFVPYTFDRRVVDEFIRVSDQESFLMARRLAREEGLLVGGSSGTAVAAALKYAARGGKHQVIVVLLPDTGRNYLTKIFSDAWMEENGFLPAPPQPRRRVGEIAATPFVSISPTATLDYALEKLGSSLALPVQEGEALVGSITVTGVLQALHDGLDPARHHVSEVMGKPLPTLDSDLPLEEAYRLFLAGESAIVVIREGNPSTLLTRQDLLRAWSGTRGQGEVASA